MPNIIDRRSNPKDNSLSNRQRFLERAKGTVKKAVQDAVSSGNIKDLENGKINVPVKGINEPTFGHDPKTGNKTYVHPGNKEYVEGDKIKKPQGGGGGPGGGKASDSGEGEDDFTFTLTKEEFLDFFFEDLELPDLVKKQINELKKEAPQRAGFTNVGNPSLLDIKATSKQSLARRIALKRPHTNEIEELEKQIEEALNTAWGDEPFDSKLVFELQQKLASLKKKTKTIPWIDPVDTRYKLFVQQPKPISKAVMFCLMDVSGSMQEREKLIAKKFFMLLSILLHRKYENVEIVFVRHHTEAEECNEDDFFHKKENGGTIVSSGLKLINEIIKARFPLDQWNIYVCQASDGDNFGTDYVPTKKELEAMLPNLQYFAYLDIPNSWASTMGSSGGSDLWQIYKDIKEKNKNMEMTKAAHQNDIWKVFKELFSKKEAA
jgi:uncharacterized sporulation protein YeaH/YhbH (DUF444 family)